MALQKKICMLGSFGVGKTSLVSQFVHSIFSDQYLTTIGVKIEKKKISIGTETVNLIIWDIAGDDRFDNLQSAYCKGAAGYLLVVDGCRLDSLKVARNIKNSRPELENTPFLCALNKADLKADWEIQNEHIEQMTTEGWDVVETSASDKDCVENLFIRLAHSIL